MSRTILQALIFLSARADNGNNGNGVWSHYNGTIRNTAIANVRTFRCKAERKTGFYPPILVYKVVDGFEIVNKLDSVYIRREIFHIFKKTKDGIIVFGKLKYKLNGII